MISYLIGKIQNSNEKYLTLLTNTGVGYKVHTPINTLLSKSVGTELELLISTIVKDDSIDLYGFEAEPELLIFEKLITVSGVGPRSALTMLSTSTYTDIALAIENNDVAFLSKTPGIGKKTCEKIIIELKGKLSKFINENGKENNFESESDARLALNSLGYNDKDIQLSIQDLKTRIKDDFYNLSTGEIIKEVLKGLK